jgi:hypothetical protein
MRKARKIPMGDSIYKLNFDQGKKKERKKLERAS